MEYKCIKIFGFSAEKRARVINELAKDGWKLVCVWGLFHYFAK